MGRDVDFTFELTRLMDRAPVLAAAFHDAEPFDHVVFDDLVPNDVLRSVAAEFPHEGWYEFYDDREIKLSIDDEAKMGPAARHLIHELNSQAVLEFLTAVTGIDGLIPDPYLFGAGLHQIRRGGLLKVHTDFNRHERMHLDRRLNLLVYLNEDWDPAYGGDLELWDAEMTRCVRRVPPSLGTCVLFATSDRSPHGHPDPLRCPPDRARRSIAMYYYTNGRPPGETEVERSTSWYLRPGETHGRRKRLVRAVVPPGLWSIGHRVAGRRRTR